MRTLKLLIAASVLVCTLAAQAGEQLRVRVTEFAPNYFMKDGRWQGLDVELAEALAAEAGMTIEFIDLPWSRALIQIQQGDLDMMMNLSRTPDREMFLNFIGPERISKRVLVVRKENMALKIAKLDDLMATATQAETAYGIQSDAKYSEEFDARLLADANFARHFEAVTSGTFLPKKVAAKRNLGFFEDENYVVHQLKSNPEFDELALHSFVLSSSPVYFGLSKKLDSGKLAKLSAAFQRLEANGSLAKIRKRWGKAER